MSRRFRAKRNPDLDCARLIGRRDRKGRKGIFPGFSMPGEWSYGMDVWSLEISRVVGWYWAVRGCVPEFIRRDNDAEFVALAVQHLKARRSFKAFYIQPGAPSQKAYSQSFKSCFYQRLPRPGTPNPQPNTRNQPKTLITSGWKTGGRPNTCCALSLAYGHFSTFSERSAAMTRNAKMLFFREYILIQLKNINSNLMEN